MVNVVLIVALIIFILFNMLFPQIVGAVVSIFEIAVGNISSYELTILGFVLLIFNFIFIYGFAHITKKEIKTGEKDKFPLILQYPIPVILLIIISWNYAISSEMISMLGTGMPLGIISSMVAINHPSMGADITLFLIIYLIITAVSFSVATKIISERKIVDVVHLLALAVLSIAFFFVGKGYISLIF